MKANRVVQHVHGFSSLVLRGFHSSRSDEALAEWRDGSVFPRRPLGTRNVFVLRCDWICLATDRLGPSESRVVCRFIAFAHVDGVLKIRNHKETTISPSFPSTFRSSSPWVWGHPFCRRCPEKWSFNCFFFTKFFHPNSCYSCPIISCRRWKAKISGIFCKFVLLCIAISEKTRVGRIPESRSH